MGKSLSMWKDKHYLTSFMYVQYIILCVSAVMEKFEVVAPSSLLLKSESAEILSSDSSTQPKEKQLMKCVLGELHCCILQLCTCTWISQIDTQTFNDLRWSHPSLLDCALEDSCQHVAIFSDKEKTYCELYSTSSDNVECRTSEQVWPKMHVHYVTCILHIVYLLMMSICMS